MAGVPGWVQVLTTQKVAGTAKSNFTTAQSIIDPTDVVNLGGNVLSRDVSFEINVRGALSNIVTAQPTFTFQVMMGAVAVWSSGALQCNASANVDKSFSLDITLRLNNQGTAAQFMGNGSIICEALAIPARALPITAPALGTAFDSTANQALDFWAACSAANVGNGVIVHDYRVKQLRFGS